MQARQRTISVFLFVFIWLFQCSAERSLALDNRKADSLLKTLRNQQPDTSRISTLLALSSEYEVDSAVRSFYYANEASFLSEKIGWQQGIADAELRIAIVYIDVQEPQEAIKHLYKSIEASKKTGDLQTERRCWQYMVHCYDHTGQHQKALDIQDHLLQMIMKTGDTAAICRNNSAYATIMFFGTGKHEEGIAWLRKDIKMAEEHLHGKIRDEVSAELLNSLANAYVRLYRTDSALDCVRQALPLAISAGDTQNVAYIYSTFCDAFFYSNKYDSAEYYAYKTLAMAEEQKDIKLQNGYHVTLSWLYEKKGELAKAIRYYKSADSLGKLIADAEKTKERSMAISRIAIEQQRQHQEQERRDLESVNVGQRNALIIAIVGLIALAIIAILIYRNLKAKEETNKIIQAQAEGLKQKNEVIDEALHDKEILLQEMHHRVKNNLQLMNALLELQVAKLTDKNAVDALMVTQQRINSMAMVHSKLYHNTADATIEVHEFVDDLFLSLSNGFAEEEGDVRLENNIAETHLSLTMLVPLGLILNELITNSFKHAFNDTNAGVIRLDMRKEHDSMILTYTDNGKGIDPVKFEDESETLGIYLIKRLTRQLKGDMVYSNDNGSTFTFTFPNEGN